MENHSEKLDRWEEKEQSQGKTEKKEKIYLDRWDEEDEQAKALLLSKEVAVKQEQIATLENQQLVEVQVEEYSPTNSEDLDLSRLRELFIRSFDEFYREIEKQLKLKEGKTLNQWLDETFDETRAELFAKKSRCFILFPRDDRDNILGFFTVKEEENSIYIAQCAIKPEAKRKGYGRYLLEHLRSVYPQGMTYWGLCRRANIPATHFYLKLGAKFMEDEQVAKKYDLDPELYTGFIFIDQPATNDNRDHIIFAPRSKSPSFNEEGVQTDWAGDVNGIQLNGRQKKRCCRIC